MSIPNDRMKAWRAFLEAQRRVLPLLESELQSETGLPLTWYDVLVQLNEREAKSMRMQDLAQAVLLSKSGLSRLVDRMEEAGLVCRRPCEEDARGFFVDLTPQGSDRLEGAAPVHVRGIIDHFTRWLEPHEAEVIGAALERVANAARPAEATLPTA